MSGVKTAAELDGLRGSGLTSARLLASAHSLTQTAQLSLESLGCASNLFLLGGVGAGLAASYLGRLMSEGGPAAPSRRPVAIGQGIDRR